MTHENYYYYYYSCNYFHEKQRSRDTQTQPPYLLASDGAWRASTELRDATLTAAG
jgi:hypothetical protein